MMGVLIPPTEEIGNRVLDPDLLNLIWSVRGDRNEVTTLARRLGPSHGLPHADHFHVPSRTPYEPMRDEQGLPVVFVAAWVDPDKHSL